jgi:hypothetical protein
LKNWGYRKKNNYSIELCAIIPFISKYKEKIITNRQFWLAMTLVLVIMATGCDVEESEIIPGAKGKITISGIPEEYNGMYIFSACSAGNAEVYGFTDMRRPNEKIKLAIISDREAKVPLYKINRRASSFSGYVKAYDGNDDFGDLTIYIIDNTNKGGFFTWEEVNEARKQSTDSISIMWGEFSNGNFTVNCEIIPEAKGKVTIINIPEEYNGRYIFSACWVKIPQTGYAEVYGFTNMRRLSVEKIKFAIISGGKAEVPLYKIIRYNLPFFIPSDIEAYDGNDTFTDLDIYIINNTNKGGFFTWEEVDDALEQSTDSISIMSGKFSDGNLTVDYWAERHD